jgi:inner membrane protein
MRHSLGLKLGAIGALSGVLLLGLLWIGSIVTERQARRDTVVKDIAASSSLAQRLEGPILVVPYEKTVREWKVDRVSGDRHAEERQVSGQILLLPEVFQLDGAIPTELRARGIYEARLYHANMRIQANFQIPPHYGVGADVASYRFGQPSIALGISDIRGIENASKALLNGAPLKLLAGSTSSLLGQGLHAPIPPLDSDEPRPLDFAIDLNIQGTSQFDLMPVGRQSRISLSSNWRSPGFNGLYLPVTHKIGTSGFDAQWSMSFFSTNLEESLRKCSGGEGQCDEFASRVLGVSFVDPVDQYLRTDRAIKYGFLFISLTFAGFFLFEVLGRLAVHPIQYSLVGAALALFYLLLLSLSEHLGFASAYLLSASACVTLIGFYVSGILRSAKRGLGFAGALALLYGMLYGLLSADDYALLMGSILVFGLLAVVMLLTREVDWSSLGRKEEAS